MRGNLHLQRLTSSFTPRHEVVESWRLGVRHASVGDCPYVVDLTGPLEREAPSATRYDDLFLTKGGRSRKRLAPLCALPVSWMDEGILI